MREKNNTAIQKRREDTKKEEDTKEKQKIKDDPDSRLEIEPAKRDVPNAKTDVPKSEMRGKSIRYATMHPRLPRECCTRWTSSKRTHTTEDVTTVGVDTADVAHENHTLLSRNHNRYGRADNDQRVSETPVHQHPSGQPSRKHAHPHSKYKTHRHTNNSKHKERTTTSTRKQLALGNPLLHQ